MKDEKMTNQTLKTIVKNRTNRIKTSEAKSKQEIADQSRDILTYVMESQDIAEVNRLMSVLSPVNLKAAQVFFRHFLPWKMPEDDVVFGKKIRGTKVTADKQELINEFLADEKNTIWTWSHSNLDVKKRPKNYAKNITNMIDRALNDENESITQRDVLRAVMAGGLDMPSLVDAIQNIGEELREETRTLPQPEDH
jgi:hypothetical protein